MHNLNWTRGVRRKEIERRTARLISRTREGWGGWQGTRKRKETSHWRWCQWPDQGPQRGMIIGEEQHETGIDKTNE